MAIGQLSYSKISTCLKWAYGFFIRIKCYASQLIGESKIKNNVTFQVNNCLDKKIKTVNKILKNKSIGSEAL